ncbi:MULTISPECIES: acyl carrier protein [unclassified Amycolatopsis]|uniref:acyl carrier protein n=1 Tax=unclassified Amycolatopsis TaxID=2618356 RepID=UPI001C69BCCC|nr:acyl carrier protein [Amycolatopsis sp. DSM 110486]QYN21268.1 acyl carrier protein [Amycolatopsis sp. DSM 110486]
MPETSVDIGPELARLIAAVTDAPVADVTPERPFTDLAGWSSHTALRLFTAVEDTFGVRLDLKTYLTTETVGALAELTAAARRPESRR